MRHSLGSAAFNFRIKELTEQRYVSIRLTKRNIGARQSANGLQILAWIIKSQSNLCPCAPSYYLLFLGPLGHLSSKSRPDKISVQMMLPIRIDKSMWTIYDNSHRNVHVPFKSWISIQKWYLSVWTVDNSNPRFGFAHSWDCHCIVTLLMVWKDYIQFLQWILYKIIELQVGKGILLIF